MLSKKRLSLLMLPTAFALLAVACGADPTATPTPVPPEPTATPEPQPEPTAEAVAAGEPAPSGPQEFGYEPEFGPCPAPCIIAHNFTVNDGIYEFKVGDAPKNPDGLFGYPQGAVVPSTVVDIVIGPMVVGTTFRFDTIRQTGGGSTSRHDFIVKDLGIHVILDDGRHGSDLGRLPHR